MFVFKVQIYLLQFNRVLRYAANDRCLNYHVNGYLQVVLKGRQPSGGVRSLGRLSSRERERLKESPIPTKERGSRRSASPPGERRLRSRRGGGDIRRVAEQTGQGLRASLRTRQQPSYREMEEDADFLEE